MRTRARVWSPLRCGHILLRSIRFHFLPVVRTAVDKAQNQVDEELTHQLPGGSVLLGLETKRRQGEFDIYDGVKDLEERRKAGMGVGRELDEAAEAEMAFRCSLNLVQRRTSESKLGCHDELKFYDLPCLDRYAVRNHVEAEADECAL